MTDPTVPILVYHVILPDDTPVDSWPPGHRPYLSRRSEFNAHVGWIAGNGFLTQTVAGIRGLSAADAAKSVALTFDDGQASDYETAFPMLSGRGMKATFYIATDFVGQAGYVDWRQLRDMQAYGMEIGSHSCSHCCFPDLAPAEMLKELIDSRRILEDRLGSAVKSFSVPYGFACPSLIRAATEAGYETICTSDVSLARVDASVPAVYGRVGIRRGNGIEFLEGIMRRKAGVLGRMIVEDRLKTLVKRSMGRTIWHKFRHLVLSSRGEG
ncbi:MAG: polysaccharide deacetylase family protein [Nitrospirae bacterium]|nr:polysaccharide deacetylase family protein [Nitrospirota bacterium]